MRRAEEKVITCAKQLADVEIKKAVSSMMCEHHKVRGFKASVELEAECTARMRDECATDADRVMKAVRASGDIVLDSEANLAVKWAEFRGQSKLSDALDDEFRLQAMVDALPDAAKDALHSILEVAWESIGMVRMEYLCRWEDETDHENEAAANGGIKLLMVEKEAQKAE